MFAARDTKKQLEKHVSLDMRRTSLGRVSDVRQTHETPVLSHLMQRHLGNYYIQSQPEATVQRKECDGSCGGTCPSCRRRKRLQEQIQTKLQVGLADDVYEREADRVAEQVMRMPNSEATGEITDSDLSSTRRLPANNTNGQQPPANFQIGQSDGRPLSVATRQFMEPRFGTDFNGVRLHTGPQAQRSAAQIQAKAFTYGNHIWLGKGANESDRKLMAHELTHTLQQSDNIVRRLPCRHGSGEITHSVNVLPVMIAEDDGSAPTSISNFDTVRNIWSKCCVDVNVLTPATENESDFKTLNFTPNVATAEPSALIASYAAGDRIPVIFHDLLDPGTGASKNGGTGGAFTRGRRIIFTVAGVAPEVVAHEIGHALGSGHGLGTRADGADTVMKASRAFDSANPHNVSQTICDNARASGFTTANSSDADCCQVLS